MSELEKKEKKYFVYILECSDKTLYTGIAVDVDRREKEHNGELGKNKGAKYTRYRNPVKVVYKIELKNKSEALKEEHRIKKLSKKQKKNLIAINK